MNLRSWIFVFHLIEQSNQWPWNILWMLAGINLSFVNLKQVLFSCFLGVSWSHISRCILLFQKYRHWLLLDTTIHNFLHLFISELVLAQFFWEVIKSFLEKANRQLTLNCVNNLDLLFLGVICVHNTGWVELNVLLLRSVKIMNHILNFSEVPKHRE